MVNVTTSYGNTDWREIQFDVFWKDMIQKNKTDIFILFVNATAFDISALQWSTEGQSIWLNPKFSTVWTSTLAAED